MTNRRLLAALAAALSLPACAGVQSGAEPVPAALLSDAPTAAPDRRCRVAEEPVELPSANALVDSAALAAAVAEAWRAAGQPAGHVLLAMRFDGQGTNVRRDVIEHRLAPEMASALQELVFTHRRQGAPAEREWSVRLRVDLGAAPVMRVGRSEVCQPKPREASATLGGGPVGSIGRVWGDMRDGWAVSTTTTTSPHEQSTVWVRVALDARGNVTDVRVERSLARAGAETRLLHYVRSVSFFPATEDGYPVPAEFSFPMRL